MNITDKITITNECNMELITKPKLSLCHELKFKNYEKNRYLFRKF